MKIYIEIDIFSGRPNPGWTVYKAEAQSLYDLLQNLPPHKLPQLMDALGYKGFKLTITDHEKKQTAQVQGNMVIMNGDEAMAFEDKNKVEQKLIEMAKAKGFGQILEKAGITQ